MEVAQADPAIELVLRLFSRTGLERISNALVKPGPRAHASIRNFVAQKERYLETVDAAIRFLQGQDSSLALRVASRTFLPEGPRFSHLDSENSPLEWAFGDLGLTDKAKYLASLYIDDLADLVREGIDPKFLLSRYGEKLAASSPTFDPLQNALEGKPSLIDEILEEITGELLKAHQPDVVGLTAPFPGNVYGAFRIARIVKRDLPKARVLLGGGYPNTELRELQDPRVFDYLDFVTLDDGERPVVRILEHLAGRRPLSELCRTFVRENGHVILKHDSKAHDIPHAQTGAPSYEGLPLHRYLSILEMLNPMHRIWSDGRWNKITLAHGCYWKKCSFCDISLDYIGRYDAIGADLLVDRIEAVIAETGSRGFHFVDEAAPPAVLKALAKRLLERKVVITWWGNIRFEKTFTPELAALLSASGCVAVSGGLEVASDRLLKLMQKGVTVEQVARVTHAFTQAGIMVHAYLMYGFPTQTESETIDALERVRQLFEAGCIQSAYWHRFSVTAHSPVGRNPDRFGIRLLPEPAVQFRFARNDLAFEDPTGADHDALGIGLNRALYNFMQGAGYDLDPRIWFQEKAHRSGKSQNKPLSESLSKSLSKSKVPKDLIARAIADSRELRYS